MRETIGSGSTARGLDFIYDESGKPLAVRDSQDGGSTFATYYYVLNLQGDVVKLIGASGTVYANYQYNAWGELLSVTNASGNVITDYSHISHVNPLRYRGYYYDRETGWYYLQSRYYDPVMHRFINADTFASTGQGLLGTNMFAYCGNNPIRRLDPCGNAWYDWAVDAWDWVTETVPTVMERTGDVIALGYECLDVEAGIGLGLYIGTDIFDAVGVELGLYSDVFTIQLNGGEIRTGTSFREAATISLPFLNTYGAADGFFQEYGSSEREHYSWEVTETGRESVELFSGGAYFFAGARYSVGFNFSKFCRRLDGMFK